MSKLPYEISKDGERLFPDQIYKTYINPKFERSNTISLCGEWKYEANNKKLIPSSFTNKCYLPYTMFSLLSRITKQKAKHYHLRKVFVLPEGYIKEKTLLCISSFTGEANIFLNGKAVGQLTTSRNKIFDISNSILSTTNTLDIDIKASKKGFFGITSEVFIQSVPSDYIKDVDIRFEYPFKEIHFTLDSQTSSGSVMIITPTGNIIKDTYKGNRFSINTSDTTYWDVSNAFMYQYTIETSSGDRVKGNIAIKDYSLGEKEGIPCFMINKAPIALKGIIDKDLYSDGWLVPSSYEEISRSMADIKRMGFNMIYVKDYIKLAYYYSCAELKGLLLAQEITYNPKTFKEDMAYLNIFSSIFFIRVLGVPKGQEEKIYKEWKGVLINKFLSVESSSFAINDINVVSKKSMIKKKEHKHFMLIPLKHGKDILKSMDKFISNDLAYLTISGMIGFSLQSLSGDGDGMYTRDKFYHNVNFDSLGKVLTNKKSD